MKESRHRKDENMRMNNRVEDRPFVPQRKADMDYKIEWQYTFLISSSFKIIILKKCKPVESKWVVFTF